MHAECTVLKRIVHLAHINTKPSGCCRHVHVSTPSDSHAFGACEEADGGQPGGAAAGHTGW